MPRCWPNISVNSKNVSVYADHVLCGPAPWQGSNRLFK